MKFNHSSILTALLVVSLLPVQVISAKGKPPPPPPEPASDVVCDGCVDTTDIADGAVTTVELSTEVNDLLDTISQLQARLDTIETQQPTPVAKLYAGNVLLGYRTHGRAGDAAFLLYEPTSGYFLSIENAQNSPAGSTYRLEATQIEYETFDCTGQGLVSAGASDTNNVLIMDNDGNYYRTIGAHTTRPLTINSVNDNAAGPCNVRTFVIDSNGKSKVEPVAYPLPYALPITIPVHSLRIEYVAP